MTFRVGTIDVLHKPAIKFDSANANYSGFQPSTSVLQAGHQLTPESRAFEESVIYDRDVALEMRDGVKLRADIFRPDTTDKVPALVVWSPYGKTGTGSRSLDQIPHRAGVPKSRLSGYEKWEGPDPAEWCKRGYAIVNIDARGIFDSEGDVRWLGVGEGQDGYDSIEELSKMSWCNQSIALVGNSWLAMAQWFIAAERPPHLKCIAPFEGASDFYRETLCRGGIPYKAFWEMLSNHFYGRNMQEDINAMLEEYPSWNEYWEDKRAKIDLINVPTYVVASFSTQIHTEGSFRGFEDLKIADKWLRVHPTQEWNDLYSNECNDELQLFLDRYTRGVQNGWEKTPRVRVSILKFNEEPIVNHVFPDWPIPATDYRQFYLGHDGHLQLSPVSIKDSLSYDATIRTMQIDSCEGELAFEYTFSQRSQLVGYSRAVLFLSCDDSDDMDVFVQLRKADKSGKVLQNVNIPSDDLEMMGSSVEEAANVNLIRYLGPTGILRASHRDIDPGISTPHHPRNSHRKLQKIPAGTIVRLEIGIWPTAISFAPGEKLVVKIAGHPLNLAEFPGLRGKFQGSNVGRHVLHFGGETPSHFVVPFVEI